MKKILLLFLIVQACILHELVHACYETAKRHIHVVSNLPQDSAPLRIHCQSKDDDLGFHNLYPNQEFQWSFCNNLLPNTLYFCHLWWLPKERVFDVYKEGFRKYRPSSSWWIAKSDGIYFSENLADPNSTKKVYDWQ